jgi:hypothetical protein
MALRTQVLLEQRFVSFLSSKLFSFISRCPTHFASFCLFQEAEVASNVSAPPGFPEADRVTITIDPNNLPIGYYGIPVTSSWLDIIVNEMEEQCEHFLHRLSSLPQPRNRSIMHIGGPEGGNVHHPGGGLRQYRLYADSQLLPNWQTMLSHVHRHVPPRPEDGTA